MVRNILLCASLSLSAMALSVDDVVDLALQNNYDLKGLEQAIEVTSEDISLASKWKNPKLTIGINDVQSDISRRDLEPMQAQYIGISQTFPITNKLEIKTQMAQEDVKVAQLRLKDAQQKLKSNIYENVYLQALAKKRLHLLNQYQKNIKELEKLNFSLYENNQAMQNDIINTNILYSKLELKKIYLKNSIDNYQLRLEEITYKKLDNIDISLKLTTLNGDQNISDHPKVQLLKVKHEKALLKSDLKQAEKSSDLTFNMAYFNRDDKYEDYMNFSVAIPLSIYKSENIKSLQAKKEAGQISSERFDLEHRFKSQLKILNNNIKSTKAQYELLQKSIIPNKEQIQKNLETYNSLNKISPKMTIKNLNEIIEYELQSLAILENHFKNYAKSLYFTGKQQ